MFFDNEDDCFVYDHNEIYNDDPNNGELKYDEIVKVTNANSKYRRLQSGNLLQTNL